jgi:serine/threonine protein kinase
MRGLLSNLNELSELNIVHRDVKLENIVFRNTLNTMPVIIDYEYAVYADDEDYVHYKCGTPGYLSPEVLLSMSNEKLTDKCDVFSVGCVFHVLLTGRFIFKGKDAK